MEKIMVLDESTNEPLGFNPPDYHLQDFNPPDNYPQLALMPVWNEYSTDETFGDSGRQDEGLPSDFVSVLMISDEDDKGEDMDEDDNFDDMDDDFDDDFDDDDEDEFDEDEDDDYDDEEDEDYDYEEDVDYDDFDE
jgi:hypothetical protein